MRYFWVWFHRGPIKRKLLKVEKLAHTKKNVPANCIAAIVQYSTYVTATYEARLPYCPDTAMASPPTRAGRKQFSYWEAPRRPCIIPVPNDH